MNICKTIEQGCFFARKGCGNAVNKIKNLRVADVDEGTEQKSEIIITSVHGI